MKIVCQQIRQPRQIGQILRKTQLPKLTQEETENLNRPKTS